MTGPEVVHEATRVLETISSLTDLKLNLASHDFGGIAIDNHGVPLPDSTLEACKAADAILMGELLLVRYKVSAEADGWS